MLQKCGHEPRLVLSGSMTRVGPCWSQHHKRHRRFSFLDAFVLARPGVQNDAMKHLKGSKFQKMLNILRRITATYAMRYDARRRCPTCMLYTSWTPTTLLLFFPWLGSGVNSSSAFWWRYAKLLGLVQHISPPISIWKERFHMIRVRTPVLQAVVYIRYPGLSRVSPYLHLISHSI
ncbi:hypothetical protein FA13DRAFT_1345650 [Coprinellus micaceus]|uniref:Uncharacterized protein n=1 Tax=Coprinellus micaceus TaxID=71717 RepID=A0A4Y7TMR1_COPMI|nr:hypothetical protein FA13DRAFT_1345650 [Coprinellus micaceus]